MFIEIFNIFDTHILSPPPPLAEIKFWIHHHETIHDAIVWKILIWTFSKVLYDHYSDMFPLTFL